MNPPHFQLCGKTHFLPHTEVVVQRRALVSHPNLGISCDLRSPRVSVALTAEWEMQDLWGMSGFLQWQLETGQGFSLLLEISFAAKAITWGKKPKWNAVTEPNLTPGTGGKKSFFTISTSWMKPWTGISQYWPNWRRQQLYSCADIDGWCWSQVMLKQMACELQQVPKEQNEWNFLLPWESQLELDLSLTQLHFLSFTGIQIQGFLCSCLQTLHHKHPYKYNY